MEETKSPKLVIEVPEVSPLLAKKKQYRYNEKEKKYHQAYHINTYPERRKEMLAYKKKFYHEKTKLFNHIRKIYLNGFKLRSRGNLHKKKYYDKEKLLLEVENKIYTPQEFYECFKVRQDNSMYYTNEYRFDNDNEETLIIVVRPEILEYQENILI